MSITSLGITSDTLRKFQLVKSFYQIKDNKQHTSDSLIAQLLDQIIKTEQIPIPTIQTS